MKGHGTGNDFVLIPDLDDRLALPASLVAAICDRRSGLGADGILRVVRMDGGFFMDYRNADGSPAEMCGNGIRVFARYLVAAGHLPPGPAVIGTRAGAKHLVVPADGDITVDMGPAQALGDGPVGVQIGGRELTGTAVSMGNPHLVVQVDEPLAGIDFTRPPHVAGDRFPDGVNVEVVTRTADDSLAMRVFERGVGETDSCGTGACAAAFAVASAQQAGLPGTWHVEVPGGRLTVELTAGSTLLTGPAVLGVAGELDPSWLAAAR